MTESGKQKLRLLSIVLLLVSAFFLLEGGLAPGWKTGMAILPIAILSAIDLFLTKGKFWRLPYVAFSLFFFFHSIKNFLAH